MILTKNPKDFGTFLLLFMLDNMVKDTYVKKDNKDFANFIKRITPLAKNDLLKMFLNIPSAERTDYNRFRPTFVNASYTGDNYIRLAKREPDKLSTKEKLLKAIDKATVTAMKVVAGLSDSEIEHLYTTNDVDLITNLLTEELKNCLRETPE